jgi:hypothetical protein
MRSGVIYEHRTSARRTSVNAGSCWPTPRAITGGGESAERKQTLGRTASGGGDLQAAAEDWPTPSAGLHNYSEDPNGFLARQVKWAHLYHNSMPLTVAAQMWPTAGANDHKGSYRPGQRRGQLDEAAEQGSLFGPPEETTAKGGPPSSSDARGSPQLPWSTPGAQDAKWRETEATTKKRRAEGKQISLGAEAREVATGPAKRLNPYFVMWLMGFPLDWLAPAPTLSED